MRVMLGLLIALIGLWAGAESAPVVDHPLHTLNFATGNVEDLHTLNSGMTNVVIFMSTQCHCSDSHLAHVRSLITSFPDFHFVIVDSNKEEVPNEAHQYFAKANLGIAVIQDQNFVIANEFKAFKTPHAFVVDPKGNLLYSGGVTDTNDFERAKHFYLRAALTAVQGKKKPELAYARTLGCEIKR